MKNDPSSSQSQDGPSGKRASHSFPSREVLIALSILGLIGLSPFVLKRLASPSLPGANEAVLDTPFVLKKGESATLRGTPLRVKFEDVPEDSRCPAGVQCFWEGNAEVRLTLISDKGSTPLVLNTSGRQERPREAVIPDLPYRLKLEGLESAPLDPQKNEGPKTYMARLLFTRP